MQGPGSLVVEVVVTQEEAEGPQPQVEQAHACIHAGTIQFNSSAPGVHVLEPAPVHVCVTSRCRNRSCRSNINHHWQSFGRLDQLVAKLEACVVWVSQSVLSKE